MTHKIIAILFGLVIFFSVSSLGISIVGPTRCEDGWHSYSIGKQGACSYHGGVNKTPHAVVGILSTAMALMGGLFIYSFLQERKNKKERQNNPICDIHNIPMGRRHGKHGDFLGCPRYPACKITKNIENPTLNP